MEEDAGGLLHQLLPSVVVVAVGVAVRLALGSLHYRVLPLGLLLIVRAAIAVHVVVADSTLVGEEHWRKVGEGRHHNEQRLRLLLIAANTILVPPLTAVVGILDLVVTELLQQQQAWMCAALDVWIAVVVVVIFLAAVDTVTVVAALENTDEVGPLHLLPAKAVEATAVDDTVMVVVAAAAPAVLGQAVRISLLLYFRNDPWLV